MDEQPIPSIVDNNINGFVKNGEQIVNNNFELEAKKPSETLIQYQENFNYNHDTTNKSSNQFDEILISSENVCLERNQLDTININLMLTTDIKESNQPSNHAAESESHSIKLLESLENSSLINKTSSNNLTSIDSKSQSSNLIPNRELILDEFMQHQSANLQAEKQTNQTTITDQSPNLQQNNVNARLDDSNLHDSSHISNTNSQITNLDSSIMAVSSDQYQSIVKEENIDAVAAVVAAVEQTCSAKTVNGDTSSMNGNSPAKSPKKKARTTSMNKSNGLNNNVHNETSPSSNQKRRKKDPNAPKAPLNGYLVYFNEERADMRMKNPQMSFGDLTKIIANKWKELSNEEKQRYTNEAEMDKERYNREMAEYKKTDTYKQYLNENLTVKEKTCNNNNHENDASTIPKCQEDGEPNLNWLQQESNIAGFDIPIFTEEFIEHSKARELEMRQLRKEITEMEHQNKVLNNHVENLKQSTIKIESDIEHLKESNIQMEKNADLFKQTILHCFNNVPLPNTQEYPTPNNIDDYILRIYSILNATIQNDQNSTEPAFTVNRQFADHVKSVFSKINFSPLFDSV